MSLPWVQVLAEPHEREAFFTLLDEYFQRAPTSSPANSAVAPRAPAVSNGRIAPPAGLQTAQPSPRTPSSSGTPFSLSSPATSTFIADQALRNPAVTSSALRQAGMSAGAANAASRFGAAHHEKLAPHVARAATSSWAAQNQSSPTEASPAPRMPPPKGPKPPSGLTSEKKGFGKTMLATKGPMSKEEARKNAIGFNESLAVRQPSRVASPAEPPRHAPPPMRARPLTTSGLGTAKVLYDYDGAEADDLPIREGEIVTIVENVSDEWLKCRNAVGSEGLVPSTYLQVQ